LKRRVHLNDARTQLRAVGPQIVVIGLHAYLR
jgi:hypothetical protein